MSDRPEVGFADLIGLWEEGSRRAAATAPGERAAVEAVVGAIAQALRKRMGDDFAADDLAALYLDGTDWCFELAMRVAPCAPEAWDMTTVAGAAFARYVRQARDFAGGRRVVREDD